MLLKTYEAKNLEYCIMVGHGRGHLQQDGPGWNRYNAMPSHTKVILQKGPLKASVKFAYDAISV